MFEKLNIQESHNIDFNFDEVASRCLMTDSRIITKEPSILSIRDGFNMIPIFTEGNISVIKGHSGVRKTTLNSILIGSTLVKGNSDGILYSEYKSDRPIIFFDTEQGDWSAQKTYQSITSKRKTDLFMYYTISDLNSKQRAKFVENRANVLNPCMIVIDGIRDLLLDFNNIGESQELIDMILGIKSRNKCHILNIIHLNKGDGKSKGHLGAFLQEKSETVMNVSFTDSPGYSVVNCEKKRGYAPFKDFEITNINGYGEISLNKSENKTKNINKDEAFWDDKSEVDVGF